MIKRIPFWISISLLVVAIITGTSLWAIHGRAHAATWSSFDKWGNYSDGEYTFYNNIWGQGTGPQTIWVNSHDNWGVWSDQPNTGGVKSYPNADKKCGKMLSSLHSVTSRFAVSVPNGGAYATTYDIWAGNNAYEIMLWMNKTSNVGPLGSYKTSVWVGGHSWAVYSGSNGWNQIYSFVRHGNTSSGNVDILAVFNWLRNNNWIGDVVLDKVQFGYEITSSRGGMNFRTTNFSITYS